VLTSGGKSFNEMVSLLCDAKHSIFTLNFAENAEKHTVVTIAQKDGRKQCWQTGFLKNHSIYSSSSIFDVPILSE
jgi:hypothetical protein